MDVNGKEDVFQLGSISVSHVPAALINMNYLRRGDPLQTATNPCRFIFPFSVGIYTANNASIIYPQRSPKYVRDEQAPISIASLPRQKGLFP